MATGKKLDKETYEKIKRFLARGLYGREIAELMGVSEATVSCVRRTKDYDDYINRFRKHRMGNTDNQADKDYDGIEDMLLRIADGVDYNNALMNGLVSKLDAICKALGV